MKTQKIDITQQDGLIKIFRNGEYEQGYDMTSIVEGIRNERITAIYLANFIAEIIHDSLNCKKVTAKLRDLDDCRQYTGTYFEYIDYLTD